MSYFAQLLTPRPFNKMKRVPRPKKTALKVFWFNFYNPELCMVNLSRYMDREIGNLHTRLFHTYQNFLYSQKGLLIWGICRYKELLENGASERKGLRYRLVIPYQITQISWNFPGHRLGLGWKNSQVVLHPIEDHMPNFSSVSQIVLKLQPCKVLVDFWHFSKLVSRASFKCP